MVPAPIEAVWTSRARRIDHGRCPKTGGAAPPFATLPGIEPVRAAPDRIVAEMTVRDDHCTRPAVLHGGAAQPPGAGSPEPSAAAAAQALSLQWNQYPGSALGPSKEIWKCGGSPCCTAA